jgi:glycosyltransferase involved in cell wall biosynthesis
MADMSPNPRVLHLLAPTREGGLEQVVTMISTIQRSAGVHVGAVLSPDQAADHPFVTRLQALGVPVTSVVVGGRSYLREYRSIAGLIDRLKPAIVHTHGYHADVIGGAAARAKGIPTVSTVHGFTQGVLRNALYEWMQRFALKRADAVIAVSEPLVRVLVKAGVAKRKIHQVRNGFTSSQPPLTRSLARARLGISPNALVAGWVGRLSQDKGADVMLDALALSDPAWKLSMIGEGRDREKLLRKAANLGISDRVTWHGHVPDAGLLMNAFDAFVLSSRTEGTPITLLEAMRACIPIVATRVGGVPDVVTSREALLVPPEQPAQIARALADIASGQSAARERGARAGDRARERFGPTAWLTAVSAVYDAASA